MKKICVFVGSRANYSSIKSVMRAVKAHSNLELQVVLGASAILDRFGKVEDLIRKDGYSAAEALGAAGRPVELRFLVGSHTHTE